MNVQHMGSGSQSSVGASTTRYFHMFSGDFKDGGGTESEQRANAASPGTISLVGLFISANDRGASTWKVRKNTADGSTSISIGASGTGQFEDTTNTDAFVDNDLLCYQVITGAGGTQFRPETTWHTFAPTSGTQTYLSNESQNFSGTADNFFAFCEASLLTTENQAQGTIGVAATLQNAMSNVQSNTRSDTCTFRTRINIANGNIAMQYLTTATGIVEDVSNTDTVADGDEINWMWDQGGGTGAINQSGIKVEIAATDAFPIFTSQDDAGSAQTAGLTWYHPVSGRLHPSETTEADAETKSNVAFTLSDLYGFVSAYSLDAGSFTVRVRINRANGNLVISFTGTGQQSDVTNADTVVDDDEVNYTTVTGGTTGSVTPRVFSLLAAVPAAVGRLRTLMGVGL